MSTQPHDEALHPRETTGKFAAKPTSEVAGGLDALAAPAEQTWTFVGHWDDSDEIVVEYVMYGDQEDTREDDGQWAGGLWAASGTGATEEEARHAAIAEYSDQAQSKQCSDCDASLDGTDLQKGTCSLPAGGSELDYERFVQKHGR